MDKRSLAALLITSSFVSPTFAATIISKLITKHHKITPSIVTTHKITKYTNFSGKWIMNCDDGESLPVVIDNDADSITINGVQSRIGQGLEGQYNSTEGYTEFDHTSYEWNEDGSILAEKSASMFKANVDNANIHVDISKFTLYMINGQINLDAIWTEFEDLTQTDKPQNLHCNFIRRK